MLKEKLSKSLLIATGVIVGLGAGIVGVVSAQSATSTVAPTSATASVTTPVDTPEPGDVPDVPSASKTHGHAPLGGDGIVSSINGTTIVMTEEANEGGTSYTVDASAATIMNKGVAGTLSDLKVGDKIFVQGTVNGTSVTATSVSLGHGKGMGHGKRANDNDADDVTGSNTSSTTTQ